MKRQMNQVLVKDYFPNPCPMIVRFFFASFKDSLLFQWGLEIFPTWPREMGRRCGSPSGRPFLRCRSRVSLPLLPSRLSSVVANRWPRMAATRQGQTKRRHREAPWIASMTPSWLGPAPRMIQCRPLTTPPPLLRTLSFCRHRHHHYRPEQLQWFYSKRILSTTHWQQWRRRFPSAKRAKDPRSMDRKRRPDQFHHQPIQARRKFEPPRPEIVLCHVE